jgi:hypothetical protein
MDTIHRQIRGRKNGLVKRKTYSLCIFIITGWLVFQLSVFALEQRRGVIQRTSDPVCNFGCGAYYLDPDPSFGFIYLRGINFSVYVGMHVEVIGAQNTCGGCKVLDVVSITILPPVGVEQEQEEIPREVTLSQNYPNPFNPATNIKFSLPHAQHVLLTVHNIIGQTVAELINSTEPIGSHTVTWDARNSAGGMYYYRLKTHTGTLVKRMMLIR